MQVRFFTIPIHGNDKAADELNQFLNTHRIASIDRSFVEDGTNSAWALCVIFEAAEGRPPAGKRGKVDYREVFDAQDFAVYVKLRDLRKTMAESDGIPPYAVFTNEQMAAMVQRRVLSANSLREIAGIGDAD